jgi:hypothetical protein
MSKMIDIRVHETHALSYMTLRRTIGLTAIALPLVLVFGKWLVDGPGVARSISAYYYTGMRDVMVGSLCAIALFLLSYKGYDRRDDWTGNIACALALAVALVPTAPPTITPGAVTRLQSILSGVHSLSAGGFFLTLAYFSYCLFTKGDAHSTPRKIWRNRIYRSCGIIIALCALGLGLVHGLPDTAFVHQWRATFWLEAVGIWAFGWSWFTKGEGILRDLEI